MKVARAAFEVEVADYFVLDFDVVVFAEFAPRAELFGHSERPRPNVDVVYRLVDERAARLALPRPAPRARLEVDVGSVPVRHRPRNAVDFADFAAVDKLLDSRVERGRALVEHDCALLSAFFCELLKLYRVRRAEGDGFFNEGVVARFEALFCERIVRERGGRNNHRVEAAGGEHVVKLFVYFKPRIFWVFHGALLACACDFRFGDFPSHEVVNVHGSDGTHSYYRKSYHSFAFF